MGQGEHGSPDENPRPAPGEEPGQEPGPGRSPRRFIRRPLRQYAVGSLALATLALIPLYWLLPLDELGPSHPKISWTVFLCALTLIALTLLLQMRDVMMQRKDTRPGLVILFLVCLSVLVFSACYFVLAQQPQQMIGLRTRLDALYFTVVTLSTVGYGDITPHGQSARSVAILQILYNFIFVTAAATTLTQQVRNKLSERFGRERGP